MADAFQSKRYRHWRLRCIGNRLDKLVKVWKISGGDEWLLVHVEIQAQTDPDLPRRMYRYHHRLVDRYGHRTATLVVLADEHPGWRPDSYEEELWGCRVHFSYPICKLLDYAQHLEGLEASSNPAAIVIAAHLAAQATRGDMELRKKRKWQLVRRLYDGRYNRQDILQLFWQIDWLMVLPEGLKDAFEEDLTVFESEKSMRYITSIERSYIEKGLKQGREEGRQEARQEALADVAVRLARKRFPEFGSTDEAAIRKLNIAQLEELSEALLDFTELLALREWLRGK